MANSRTVLKPFLGYDIVRLNGYIYSILKDGEQVAKTYSLKDAHNVISKMTGKYR